MEISFHHLNIASHGQPEMADFYRNVFGFRDAGISDHRHGLDDYPGGTNFLTDGKVEFHLSEADHHVGFRSGHIVNPLDHGHVAFRTDDIVGFMKRLDDLGIPYSEYGVNWMSDWHQVYFYDPAGTVIEVHQPGNPRGNTKSSE